MSRPKGSYTPGSLRSRIRDLLSDGYPRSARVIAAILEEPLLRVQDACGSAAQEGLLSVKRRETEYALPREIEPPTKARNWFDV